MKGWYAAIVVDRVPPLRDVCELVGFDGEFYACYHQNMDGSFVIEIASAHRWSDECKEIFILEFFGEAFLEARGVYVVNGSRVLHPKRRSTYWTKVAGKSSLIRDTVDIMHPRALHASDFF